MSTSCSPRWKRALEERQRPATRVEVSQVLRQRLDEVGGRRYEGRDHEETEEPERGERDDEHDGCRATPCPAHGCSSAPDHRVERHRQERGDQHPRDGVEREVHEQEREDGGCGDAQPR